jgi:hypothetical protein
MIDVWVTSRAEFEAVRRFMEGLVSRLDEENRAVIVAIKTA